MIFISIILLLFVVDGVDESAFLSAYDDGSQEFYVIKDAQGVEQGIAFLKVQRDQEQIKLQTRIERERPDSGVMVWETAWFFKPSGEPLQCSRIRMFKQADGKVEGSARTNYYFSADRIFVEDVRDGEPPYRLMFERPEGLFPLILDIQSFSLLSFDSWVIFSALADEMGGSPPVLFVYRAGDQLAQYQHRVVTAQQGVAQLGEETYPGFEFMIAEQANLAISSSTDPGSIVPRQLPGSHIELDARAASQGFGDVKDYETLRRFRNKRTLTNAERATVRQIMNRHQAESLQGDIAPTIRLAVIDGRLAAFRHVTFGGIFLLDPTGEVDIKINFEK